MREEITPDRIGEMNQDATMRSIFIHLIESKPLSTMENPIVAPTMLCVPEIGILSAVAITFQVADPDQVLVSEESQ